MRGPVTVSFELDTKPFKASLTRLREAVSRLPEDVAEHVRDVILGLADDGCLRVVERNLGPAAKAGCHIASFEIVGYEELVAAACRAAEAKGCVLHVETPVVGEAGSASEPTTGLSNS